MPPSPDRKVILHVSYPICKSLDMSTDFLVDRHTWSPHGKGRDGVPSYRYLARGQVGSEVCRKQACLLHWIHTRCTVVRRTLQWYRKPYAENTHPWAFITTQLTTNTVQMYSQAHTPLLPTDRKGVKSPCSKPPLPPPDCQSPQNCASHGNLSSSLQLSLVYSEPSISATLHSANYAILSAEAPPKLPFCYNQTLSQSESVPATPTCHRHSKPQDNLLCSQNMRFIPKWDIHHVIEKLN